MIPRSLFTGAWGGRTHCLCGERVVRIYAEFRDDFIERPGISPPSSISILGDETHLGRRCANADVDDRELTLTIMSAAPGAPRSRRPGYPVRKTRMPATRRRQ